MSPQTPQDDLPQGLFMRALEAAGEGIVVVDGEQPEHPVAWVNAAFERISGFTQADLAGSNLRVLQGGDREQSALAELRAAVSAGLGCSVLLRNYRPDGAMYWNQLRVEPYRDESGHLWWLGFSRDVSAQQEMEIMLGRREDDVDIVRKRLPEAESVDRVTGLQNERSFELSLELTWFSCARDRRPLALFLFAPDYFDAYVETFGRIAGESCLKMVARSVAAAFRRNSDVAARIGDAEFASLGTDMAREVLEPHARRVCDRVRALALRNPHAPLTRTLTFSALVLLVRPGRAPDWRGMLAEARRALAEAQLAGTEQLLIRDFETQRD